MASADSTSPGPGAAEEPVTIDQLFDDDTGRWQITTQTSIHLLDLDQRTVTRIPGAAAEHGVRPQTGPTYAVATLAGDRQTQSLYLLLQCLVGEPMYLYTDADPTGITLRGTTPVREIRRLPGRTPSHDQ